MWTLPEPPPYGNVGPVFHWLNKGDVVHRVFDPTRYGATANGFRYAGPFARFDHHVTTERRGIMYAAENFGGALSLVFAGHTEAGYAGSYYYSAIVLQQSVRLLDVRPGSAPKAGAHRLIGIAPTLAIAQRWSRHFYGDAKYGGIAGLVYSLENGRTAYAFYDRSFNGELGYCQSVGGLSQKGPIRDEALIWAARLGFMIDFDVTRDPDDTGDLDDAGDPERSVDSD